MYVGPKSKTLSWMTRLFIVIHVAILITSTCLVHITATKVPYYHFFTALMAVRNVWVVSLILVFVFKGPIIAKLLGELMLIETVAQTLRRWEKIFVFLLIFLTTFFGLTVGYALRHPGQQGVEVLKRFENYSFSAYCMWYVYVMCVAMVISSASFVYILLHLGCAYYVKFCQEKLILGQIDLHSTREMYDNIQDIRSKMNQLGLIPFILFSQLFVMTTLSFINAILYLADEESTLRLMELENVVMVAIFVTVNFLADSCTKKTHDVRDRILRYLSNAKCQLSDCLSIPKAYLDISRSPVVAITAWDFYLLEKPFVMRFFGALIPFVVMAITAIIQLQEILKSKPRLLENAAYELFSTSGGHDEG
ncbi:hypothetical protein HDE_03503 [Halotydeus destructor]|nr:hypothetical protein HDE_03503 [Halotydeus destructor]